MSVTQNQGLVPMPRLSDGMEEGTIVGWLIADGESVTEGDDLVEIETDKATVIYQAPFTGILTRLLAEGDSAPVGAPIADLGGDRDGTSKKPETRSSASPLASRLASEAGLDLETVDGSGPRGRVLRRDVEARLAASAQFGRPQISPAARRRAAEAQADLADVTGSGPGGRIRLADVEAQVSAARPVSPESAATIPSAKSSVGAGSQQGELVPLTRSQSVVARRIADAKATIPDFQVSVEIDMDACRELRAALIAMERDGPTPSFNDMVIKACALALREHPRVNSSYRGKAVEIHPDVNVGMAVAAGERLLVATVTDADQRSLEQIAFETRRLAGRVRDETITPAELSRATFTVSNLGMLGVDDFTAVINPPQAAILAVGTVGLRPVVRDSELAVGATMRATLSADHRILYGADAAAFVATVRRNLEHPLALLLGTGLGS
jgi:pyruvate dehydrogenase E2 component (dihydrolipoamide acetyltransferase)